MTPKQILDSFSETLMGDERILSPQERALLTNLLHHAKTAAGQNQATREAVRTVIASAVGETVAQRAFAVLGASIVERIVQSGAGEARARRTYLTDPQTPGVPRRLPEEPETPGITPGDPETPGMMPEEEPETPGISDPQTPGHMRGPQPPATPEPQTPGITPAEPQTPGRLPEDEPETPGITGPQTPGHGMLRPVTTGSVHSKAVMEGGVAVLERPEILPARCVVLDEFLAPQELAELTRFTVEHEKKFSASEVLSPHSEKGVINYKHRRSRVLMDLARHQDVMVERVKSVLPEILRKLDMRPFTLAGVEAQITASNDGDFFHFHSDNGSDRVACRYLTFVYFFHREPKAFEGGDLRIHDSRLQDGLYVSQGTYQTIVPRQNQIVFFPCEMRHEITPVKCPSRLFADSRFTLNGWLRR